MENKRPYWQVAVSLLFSLLATATFIILVLYLGRLFLPFVIGWILALIATPFVGWLEKRFRIVRKLGSAITVIAVLALIVFVIYLTGSKLVAEASGFIQNFPSLYEEMDAGFKQISASLDGVFARLPANVQEVWNGMIAEMSLVMGELVARISDPTVTAVGNFAKNVPSYLIGIIVAILSAYFFTVQREEVIAWVKKVSPPSVTKRMTMVTDNLKYAVGGYFKAQFKIMGVIFLILWVAFMLIGVDYAVLVALLIAFLDFFPFLGTGTALLPWALYEFLVADYKMAIILLVIYGVSQLTHQLIQPKMLSTSMNMNPLVTLLLLYLGYKIASVFGMILAVPVGLILINMVEAGAFDYIINDVKILVEGILGLREEE